MKMQEIREKNKEELTKNIVEMRNKMTKMRFDIAAKQVKNHREFRKAKKDMAKFLTVLAEKKKN